MKSNAVLFWTLCAFFTIAAVLYTVWALTVHGTGVITQPNYGPDMGHVEWVGTLALGLCAVMFAFLGYYVGKTYQSQGGELAEDRLDANIDDGDPEVGHFSPWSWWPILLSGSASLIFLGVAIGAWIAIIGVVVLIITLVGWTYEYYRGYFAH